MHSVLRKSQVVMDDDILSKQMSHKGSKIKAYTMSFKQTAVKFARENSINSAALKFNVDRKRVREWISNIDEISAKKSTRKRLDGGGRKPVIVEIEEKLLEWIHEKRSKMLHVSRKMIQIKAKAMFDDKTDDPAVKETFLASNSWIQKFMKRHHLSCRLVFIYTAVLSSCLCDLTVTALNSLFTAFY